MLDIDWELLLRYCERECAPRDRERFDRWRGAMPRFGWLAAAVALLLISAPVALRVAHHHAAPARRAERTVSTRLGERAIVRLSDGTQIVLAAASTLRYATAQLSAAREVEVTGEAYFDVAHDTARPFVVHA